MGLFSRGNKENFSIRPESHAESSESTAEKPKLSGAERVANLRKGSWEKIKGVFKKTAEIGKKFVGGFDRVAGAGVEGYDATKAAVSKGAEAYQAGMDKLYTVPDMLGAKADEGLDALGRGAVKVGKGLKRGAEAGVGFGVAVAYGGYKLGEAGIDWADRKMVQGGEFVAKKYEGLKDWAGEQAENIQNKAVAARESFSAGVEKARGWKNQAMDAYHQNRFEAHFVKLSPEAQASSMERLKQIQAGKNLKTELGFAS